MGTNYYLVENRPTVHAPLHIGKSSFGWKFCFHAYDEWESWPWEEELHTFGEWKDFIEKKVSTGECIIMNEYDNEVSARRLFELITEEQKNDNPDNFKYSENIGGYRFESGEWM